MKDRIGIFLGFKIQLPVIEGVAAIDDSSSMTLVDELGNGVCGVDGMTFTLRRLFRAFFFFDVSKKKLRAPKKIFDGLRNRILFKNFETSENKN